MKAITPILYFRKRFGSLISATAVGRHTATLRASLLRANLELLKGLQAIAQTELVEAEQQSKPAEPQDEHQRSRIHIEKA